MPFIDDIQNTISQLGTNDPYRITLEYLANSAIGKKNAVPIEQVVAHLERNGHHITKEGFQQTILSKSRQSSICIASSRNGIYLIKTLEDALAFNDFYGKRFQTTELVLNRFRELANQKWPDSF